MGRVLMGSRIRGKGIHARHHLDHVGLAVYPWVGSRQTAQDCARRLRSSGAVALKKLARTPGGLNIRKMSVSYIGQI